MVVSCAVHGCKSRSNKGNGLSFHCFPADPTLCQRWLIATKRDNSKPTRNAKVCSLHFQPDDFINNFGKRGLKPNVVPTLISATSQQLKPIWPGLSIKANAEQYSTPNIPSVSNCLTSVTRNAQLVTEPKKRITSISSTSSNGNFKSQPNVVVTGGQSPQNLKIVNFRRLAPLNMRVSNWSTESRQPSFLPSESQPSNELNNIDQFTTSSNEAIDLDSEIDSGDEVLASKQLSRIHQFAESSSEPIDVDSEIEADEEEQILSVSNQIQVAEIRHSFAESNCRSRRMVPAYVGDVREEDLQDPVKRKRAWEIARHTITKCRKKIKVLGVRLHRMEKKNKTLNDLICTLMNDYLGVKTLYIDTSE